MQQAARIALLGLSLAVSQAAAGRLVAAEAGDPKQPRYTLTPAGEGFLRLDSVTGAVSHCLVRRAHWVCESVADDRLALQEEIDRLGRENAALKARLAEEKVARPEEKTPPPSVTLQLPKRVEEDLRSLRGYVEKLYRDLRSFAERLAAGPEPRQL